MDSSGNIELKGYKDMYSEIKNVEQFERDVGEEVDLEIRRNKRNSTYKFSKHGALDWRYDLHVRSEMFYRDTLKRKYIPDPMEKIGWQILKGRQLKTRELEKWVYYNFPILPTADQDKFIYVMEEKKKLKLILYGCTFMACVVGGILRQKLEGKTLSKIFTLSILPFGSIYAFSWFSWKHQVRQFLGKMFNDNKERAISQDLKGRKICPRMHQNETEAFADKYSTANYTQTKQLCLKNITPFGNYTQLGKKD